MTYTPHLQAMMSEGRGRILGGGGKYIHCYILAYLLLILAAPCAGFLPNFWSRVLTFSWSSHTHQYITEQSILNVTLETLRSDRKHQENHAEEQVSWHLQSRFYRYNIVQIQVIIICLLHLIPNMVKIRFSLPQTRLGRGFWRAVSEVAKSNAAMDFLSSTRSDPVYHFDSERVDSAMVMLRQLWAQTLLSVRAKEYQSARHSLGQLFHSLQVRSDTVIKTQTTKDKCGITLTTIEQLKLK